jgi:UBX domain-containing protein 1
MDSSDSSNNSELVAKFCGVTAANPEQAKFYLESTEWQIEPALQLFFEADTGVPQTGGGGGGVGPTPMNLADYDLSEDENMSEQGAPGQEYGSAWEPIPPAAMAAAAAAPVAVRDDPPAPPPQRRSSVPVNKPKGKEKGSARKSASSRGGVTTLGDLGKHPESDSDSDGQEYYTGGEKSGMVVQDPNKKPSRKDVEAMFERVRRAGAQEGPVPEPARPAAARSSLFSGSSHTLSGETRQQEQATSETPASPPAPIVHNVVFWRNGFTVNGGPLRRLDDPLNLPFLESINRSECPRELEPADRSVPVNVNLVKRITEDWQAPPEPKYVAFKGQGHTLGTKPASGTEDGTPVTNTNDAAPRPSQGLIIDDAKPATSIQLRLSDGTRMVARFNTHHTVADIRGFIDAARPGSTGPYQLQTMGFPPVKLTDSKQTIEGAGLLNAVVIQKA